MQQLNNVCVFCGSRSGNRPGYAEVGYDLGAMLAARDIGLVYGASSVGMMGAVADGVLDAGGRAVGVIPRHLTARELPHQDLTELHVVESMHERKALMFDRSDAFIALPGGLGTLDELFEVLTWSQLGIHAKAVGLLDVDDYFEHLVAFMDRTVADDFVRAEHRDLLVYGTHAGKLLDELARFDIPPTEAWIDEEGR